jgi:hypothetical protein
MSCVKTARSDTRDYEGMSRGYAVGQRLVHTETEAEYRARITQDADAFPELHEAITGYLDAFNGACACGHILSSEATYKLRGAD